MSTQNNNLIKKRYLAIGLVALALIAFIVIPKLRNTTAPETQKTPKKEIEMALKIKAEYELEIAKSKK